MKPEKLEDLAIADKNELVAAAGGSVTIAGKTYLASPPTDNDMMTIRRWIRQNAKFNFDMGPLLVGLSPEDRAVVLREMAALRNSGGALTPEVAMDTLTTPAGCAFMAWVSVRRNHPDVKLEDLQAAITETNVDQVFCDLDRATGMAHLGKTGGRSGSATQ